MIELSFSKIGVSLFVVYLFNGLPLPGMAYLSRYQIFDSYCHPIVIARNIESLLLFEYKQQRSDTTLATACK